MANAATVPAPRASRFVLTRHSGQLLFFCLTAAGLFNLYALHHLDKAEGVGLRLLLTGLALANILFVFFIAASIRHASRAERQREARIQSEYMLRAIFEDAYQFVGLLDHDGKLLRANKTALDFIGRGIQEVRGLPYWETPWWLLPDAVEQIRAAVLAARSGRLSRFQTVNIGRDGRAVNLDVSVKPLIFDADHVEFILVEGRDISDILQAKAVMEQSRHQLMEMAVSVPGVLFQMQEAQRREQAPLFAFTFLSQRFQRVFGMSTQDVSLDTIAGFMLEPEAFRRSFREALERPPRWEHLGAYRDPQGQTRWVRVKARIQANSDDPDTPRVVNGVFLDETDQIQAQQELAKARDVIFEQEKLASLGSMVAGVAHEINTPLGVALTAASQLDKDVQAVTQAFEDKTLTAQQMAEFVEDAREASRLMLANCTRAADLVRSFKQVAADQSVSEARAFLMADYLRDVALSLRPQLKRTGHELEVVCPDGLEVVCDPGALAQIVSNLIMNALNHAFEGLEKGRMRLEARLLPESQPGRGDMVQLTFADNGRGMAETVRKRAFDPFFTTRRGSGGTGLGLHIVYNLAVTSLQGAIGLESEEGKGTTFTILFPARPPRQAPSAGSLPEPDAAEADLSHRSAS